MKMKARIRRIGNSLGVIIPSEEAARHGLSEGDSVELAVERQASLKSLFGSATFSLSAQELKDEARKGWRD